MDMKRTGILMAMAAVLAANAEALTLPAPVHADGEASAWAGVPEADGGSRTLKVTLSFDASPANSAEVALGNGFGDDAPDPDNTAFIAGWDCGEFFIRCDRLRKRFTAPAPDPSAPGPRTLPAAVRLGRGGVPVHAAFESDGAPVVFGGLDTGDFLSWAGQCGWENMRAVSRGSAGSVSAEARLHAEGSVVIWR